MMRPQLARRASALRNHRGRPGGGRGNLPPLLRQDHRSPAGGVSSTVLLASSISSAPSAVVLARTQGCVRA